LGLSKKLDREINAQKDVMLQWLLHNTAIVLGAGAVGAPPNRPLALAIQPNGVSHVD